MIIFKNNFLIFEIHFKKLNIINCDIYQETKNILNRIYIIFFIQLHYSFGFVTIDDTHFSSIVYFSDGGRIQNFANIFTTRFFDVSSQQAAPNNLHM